MSRVILSSTPAALLVSLAVLVTFANIFGNSWHYDDLHSITENPHLQSLREPLRFLTDPTLFSRDADKAMFRPLLLFSFALNYSWSELGTWSWHVVNLGLHLGCTLALWQILGLLGRGPGVALFGALIFGLHPLATEPVNYISSRSESLSAVFVLCSFWFHLRAGRKTSTWHWRAASVLAFTLGVMTKSIAITTPVLLLAHDGLRYGWRPSLHPRKWAPYAVVGVGYLAIVGAHVSRAVVSDAVRGPWEQLVTQAKAGPYYAKLLSFPIGLNVHHQFFAGGTWTVVSLSLLAVASLVFVSIRRAPRDVTFGLIWIAVVLAPTFIVPLHVLVNDHRLYLPLAGVAIALTQIVTTQLVTTMQHRRLGAMALLLLIVLSVSTRQRSAVWENEYTLWSDAAAKSPTPLVPVAYVHLGNYAKSAGHLDEAEAFFRRALEIAPDHVAARNNLGITLQRLGRLKESVSIYRRITEEEPHVVEAWYNLGKAQQQLSTVMASAGNQGEALEAILSARSAYRRAADRVMGKGGRGKIDSRGPASTHHRHVILNNLGTTYERTGRVDSASVYYQQALALSPYFADARNNLTRLVGSLQARAPGMIESGALLELQTLCEQLVAATPDLVYVNPLPLFFLSISRFHQGAYDSSIEANRQLVAQYPVFEEGYLQLGNAYETVGARRQAAEVYRQHLLRIPAGQWATEASSRLRRLEEAR
jgi:tetratricopeptide (TPR) repeat protein